MRLEVGRRSLWASAVQDGCVELGFDELCGGLTSVGDLLELAERYATVVLSQVPPLASVPPDSRRRFADLVDVLWDRDVRLVVLAAGPQATVLDAAGVTDRERMVSRLGLLPTV